VLRVRKNSQILLPSLAENFQLLLKIIQAEIQDKKKPTLEGWPEWALKETTHSTTLKTWKEKADGRPLLQLKISPTISLELQSSQPGVIAIAANLTLR